MFKLSQPLSTMVIQGSCLVFDFDFPVKGLCWLAEGDWLRHQCKPPGRELCTIQWENCLVWKKARLKGSCHSGSGGCGRGTQQRASSASLRQQREHHWSFIYWGSSQRFRPRTKLSSGNSSISISTPFSSNHLSQGQWRMYPKKMAILRGWEWLY